MLKLDLMLPWWNYVLLALVELREQIVDGAGFGTTQMWDVLLHGRVFFSFVLPLIVCMVLYCLMPSGTRDWSVIGPLLHSRELEMPWWVIKRCFPSVLAEPIDIFCWNLAYLIEPIIIVDRGFYGCAIIEQIKAKTKQESMIVNHGDRTADFPCLSFKLLFFSLDAKQNLD